MMLQAALVLTFAMTQAVLAASPEGWVPVRWPGGPLEVARRGKDGTLPGSAAAREAIRQWYSNPTLDLLAGTPFNCLLVTWSFGGDAAVELTQQRLLRRYAAEARNRGLDVLGTVYTGADLDKAVAAAGDAGLAGVVLEGVPDGDTLAARLQQTLRKRIPSGVVFAAGAAVGRTRRPPPAVVASGEALWPDLRIAATSTATSAPWIDSNLWLASVLRSQNRPAPVWLTQQPPEVPPAQAYQRAVADAGAAGARWVVSLDDELRRKLFAKAPDALATWRGIARYAAFFEQHAAWREFRPVVTVTVISDARSASLALPKETVKLIARRNIPVRMIERQELADASLEGDAAAVATGLASPAESERRTLSAFASAGGLLVAGPAWDTAPPGDTAYAVAPLGKGRVALYRARVQNPDAVARDLTQLLGTRRLPYRLFNAASEVATLQADASGRRLLLQLVSYASLPSESITVRVAGTFRTARLLVADAAPVDLPVEPAGETTEVVIPKLSLHAAVLFER